MGHESIDKGVTCRSINIQFVHVDMYRSSDSSLTLENAVMRFYFYLSFLGMKAFAKHFLRQKHILNVSVFFLLKYRMLIVFCMIVGGLQPSQIYYIIFSIKYCLTYK